MIIGGFFLAFAARGAHNGGGKGAEKKRIVAKLLHAIV
jgi:hypothetical protein